MVVSLISLARGVTEGIGEQLDMIGGDLIMVMPGEGFDIAAFLGGMEIKDRDIEAIRRARGVDKVLESPFAGETVRWENRTETTFLWGIDYTEGLPVLETLMGIETSKGNLPRAGRREVVVGSLVPRDIFPEMEVGDELVIGGRRFTVSGILRSLGNQQDDLSIMIDLVDFRDATGKREGTQVAFATAKEGFDTDIVAENIERELKEAGRRPRGEEAPSFTVMTAESAADIAARIMGVLHLTVYALGGIAVVVGAIGVMNSMFTAVRERTKEIGVLKAVGAKKRDIISVFLAEAGIIGLIGGMVGVVLGIAAAKTGEYFIGDAHPVFYIEAYVSLSLVLITLFISFVIGAIAGFLPARRAAQLQPVDALRYE